MSEISFGYRFASQSSSQVWFISSSIFWQQFFHWHAGSPACSGAPAHFPGAGRQSGLRPEGVPLVMEQKVVQDISHFMLLVVDDEGDGHGLAPVFVCVG
jgi:hypothetical protein